MLIQYAQESAGVEKAGEIENTVVPAPPQLAESTSKVLEVSDDSPQQKKDIYGLISENAERDRFIYSDEDGLPVFPAPESVRVSGRVGFNSAMNGVYKRGNHIHDGRVYYQHENRKFVIRWFAQKKNWLFDWRGLNNDNICAAAGLDDVSNPSLVTHDWRVFDGSTKQWHRDSKLRVTEVATKILNHAETENDQWEDADDAPEEVLSMKPDSIKEPEKRDSLLTTFAKDEDDIDVNQMLQDMGICDLSLDEDEELNDDEEELDIEEILSGISEKEPDIQKQQKAEPPDKIDIDGSGPKIATHDEEINLEDLLNDDIGLSDDDEEIDIEELLRNC